MKKKTFKIIASVIIGLLTVILTILLLLANQKENKYRTFLTLGDKYLEELNYEDAIVAYSDAINIMPKKESAYIQLSNVYISNNDYDNARKVLGDYIIKISSENQSEAVQVQQDLIDTKEKEYTQEIANSDNDNSLQDKENDISKSESVISIAERVLGMEYSGGRQFDCSFEKREGLSGDSIIISPVENDNILSAVCEDFDGDGQEEILIIVRNYNPESDSIYTYNTLSFYMLEQRGSDWIYQDQIAIEEYDLHSGYNVTSVPKKLDFYLEEVDGCWNIYFEGHELAQYFSDGYGWILFGCTYTEGRFERKFEAIETAGSSIDEFLFLDPDLTYEQRHREIVLEFIKKVENTGLNIEKIDMDYPVMDINPDIVKFCRIEYTTQLQHEVTYDWLNDPVSRSLSGITEKNIDYINTDSETAEDVYLEFMRDNGFEQSYYKILKLNEQNEKFLLICSAEDVMNYKDIAVLSGGSDSARIYGVVDGNVSYLGEISCRSSFVLGYQENKLWVTRTKETELYEVNNHKLVQVGTDKETVFDIIVFEKLISTQ